VIDGFRWALLGGKTQLDGTTLAMSLTVISGLLILGIWYFRKTERTFVDVI
jgi:lipopolysaccharide transport system permease protein